ncbi:MAG: PIN domain-containing protein [Candidatus Aenigmatarchaeota archaeon]
MKVFIDTNFLMDLIRFKVEVEKISEVLFCKYNLFILSSSILELKKLARNKGEEGKLARAALKFIELKKINVWETEENPDKAFLSLADKNTIIATNDSKLRKKLREAGIKTIYLRGNKKVEVS